MATEYNYDRIIDQCLKNRKGRRDIDKKDVVNCANRGCIGCALHIGRKPNKYGRKKKKMISKLRHRRI
ncbi:MAG: hypothetical protein Homavirus20_2 [Homavirus sp.]|uniref:Uncharacterized protein n=1 Tax=Homavirus sp. TaxID=2487769 RepID=A0A3G5A6X3_9VIRU|nr:MAG: hypothetical protein Homavirus20_2 [Homavirus sp.]